MPGLRRWANGRSGPQRLSGSIRVRAAGRSAQLDGGGNRLVLRPRGREAEEEAGRRVRGALGPGRLRSDAEVDLAAEPALDHASRGLRPGRCETLAEVAVTTARPRRERGAARSAAVGVERPDRRPHRPTRSMPRLAGAALLA